MIRAAQATGRRTVEILAKRVAIEARTKLDSLLSAGRPFKTVEEALMLVYSRG